MKRFALILLVFMLALAACADSAKPEDVVIPYLEALLSSDEDRFYQRVCPEWEADAKRDFDAFTGVTGELQDATCTKTGTDGDYTLVSCTGTMVLDYNGEIRNRSLADQTYRVKKVGADWKVCGYQ